MVLKSRNKIKMVETICWNFRVSLAHDLKRRQGKRGLGLIRNIHFNYYN